MPEYLQGLLDLVSSKKIVAIYPFNKLCLSIAAARLRFPFLVYRSQKSVITKNTAPIQENQQLGIRNTHIVR